MRAQTERTTVGGERYPKKLRLRAIRLYSAGGLSAAVVAKRLSLKVYTVKEWVRAACVIRSQSEAAALSISSGRPRGRATARLWHFSKKTGDRNFAESSLEFLRMDQLDADRSVATWSRCPHRIAYLCADGKTRNYVPDLIVVSIGGRTTIEETKPRAMIALPINLAKFAAATTFCKSRGWKFRVLTEDDVGYARAMAPSVLSRQERMQRRNDCRRKRFASETPEERASRLKKNAAYMRRFNADRKRRCQRDLPVGSFSESGTNVNVAVLKIHNRET
jgi:transposase-like protein